MKRLTTDSGVRIYRIPCQAFDDLSAFVYLLLGAGPPTLVDAGSGHGQATANILSGLAAVRHNFGETIQPTDVRAIIVTHAHLDHFGGAAELQEHTGAEIGIHPLDLAAVSHWEEHSVVIRRKLADFLLAAGLDCDARQAVLRASRFDRQRARGVPIGFLLQDSEERDGLRVIHTPGHSPGHVCLAIENVLISGDHILAKTIPQQWPQSMAGSTGLAHYLESLEKVAHMPGFQLALASHEPIIHEVYHRIGTIRGSHLRRLERLLDLVRRAARPLTIHELTDAMYGSLSGFRGFLAIMDIGARVEYLHQRGRLVAANLDEIEAQEHPVFRYVAG